MNWFKKSQFDEPPNPEITKWELMGLIRAHLEGTNRFTTKELLYGICKNEALVQRKYFDQVIDEMIDRGFLTEEDGYIMWDADAPGFPGNKPL